MPTGAYNEETVDDVALGVPGWRVQEGARPLAGVVAEIMSTHVGLKGAAILVPNNFNIKGFADTINGKGLMLFVVRTVGLPPADLTETSLKRMAKLSRPITVDDMRSLRHFNRYHGPDRFVLVLRKSSFFRTEGEPLGISSKERRALARRDNVDDFEGGLVIDDYDVRVHSKGRADFRQRMLSRYRGWDQAFNGSVRR